MKLAPAALVLCFAAPALANGRFPQGSQLVFDPTDPQHLNVTTTFGWLDSRDGGRTFDWRCETALGLGGETDMMLAIPASGGTVLATFNGLFTTRDGCSFQSPPELAGVIVPDLTLTRSRPDQLFAFRMLGLGEGRFDSVVMRSDDAGATWHEVSKLPAELLPLSIDVAPSDPARVYLSGSLGRAADFGSVLLRSEDGGVTFESAAVPDTSGQRAAFIAGVRPGDADRVFVRVDDPSGTVVWSSADAGRSFQRWFSGTGRLPGFAFAPDGDRVAMGGPTDGLWVGNVDGTQVLQRSSVGPTCLGWNQEALYACATASTSGFSVGRSTDAGASFEALFTFDRLCGNTSCGPETTSGSMCAVEWEIIAPALGPACLEAQPGSAGARGGGEGAAPRAVSASGGGCTLQATRGHRSPCWPYGVLLACAGVCRLRPRAHTGLRPTANSAGMGTL